MKSVCLGQEGGVDLSQRSVTPRERDARASLDSLRGTRSESVWSRLEQFVVSVFP